tara:strand:- start:110 stop:253 length:144 start_codon:yes stop_codon:yes gene_type:complete
MPGIDFGFLQKLQTDYKSYPNFIETGTYKGETIFFKFIYNRNKKRIL